MADPDIPVVYGGPITMNPPYITSQSHNPSHPHSHLTESELRTLLDQGYTAGLGQALARNNAVHVLRIWVVDNSGSMTSNDGHRLVETKRAEDVKLVGCTRWTELQECVSYHAQLAALIQAPTIFRMLNDPGRAVGPQRFSVAEHHDAIAHQDLTVALQTIRNSHPGGATPLSQHVLEIRNELLAMESSMKHNGTKVALVLATDGLPTDARGYGGHEAQQEFIRALRSLEGLPVWIVVRLCTDEENVVEFYNQLDSQLELSLDVLDDFVGEATEIHKVNGWLNYALPLHRMREMGIYDRLIDLLDERRLTKDELRDFLLFLFGDANFDGVPDPQADWEGFLRAIDTLQKKEKKQWNPITKKLAPWIDVKKLNHAYNTDSACVIS